MKFTTIFTTFAFCAAAVMAMPAPVKSAPAKSAPAKTSTSLIQKLDAARKGKPAMKSTACLKRDGACKNLFVVFYKPAGSGSSAAGGFQSPRHWSLFLTASSTVDNAVGDIYQVGHNSQHASGLGEDFRMGKKVTDAGRFDSAVLLGSGISSNTMNLYVGEIYMEVYLDDIVEHNSVPQNMRDKNLSNCQHWVEAVVQTMEHDKVLPEGALAKVTSGPRS